MKQLGFVNYILSMLGLVYFCLFGVLRRFQHCTGHITTGSWKGRGNQYIEFARVVYCKLPTNGKQLPAFPLKAVTGIEPPTSEVGGESVTTLPPWPPMLGLDEFFFCYRNACKQFWFQKI